MNTERVANTRVLAESGVPHTDEVETYSGRIVWHKYRNGGGRVYRFGLIELNQPAGEHFVGGSNEQYQLVVLFDARNVGHAYAFKQGGEGDYLSPRYVSEKLGQAFYFEGEAAEFTRKLGSVLGRPTS